MIEGRHDEDAATDMMERPDDTHGPAFFAADRVPARSEVIRRGLGIELDVLDFDPRRIKRPRAGHLPVLMSGM